MPENNLLEIVKNLNERELQLYKDFIKFFSLLGVSEEDLANFVKHIKFQKEFEDKANAIINDQKKLDNRMTELLMKIEGLKDPKYKNNLRNSPLEEMNATSEMLKL